jgi:glucan phosphoethanolaminetransferase (alkaline phosphatase superfamily)
VVRWYSQKQGSETSGHENKKVKDRSSKGQIEKKRSFKTWAGAVSNSKLFALVLRFAFVAFLIAGERMFLGPISRARGRTDVATSIAMMLLVILFIERFSPHVLKKILLFSAGALLIFFQLLTGLYYRFFHCPVPFDIFHQWHDLFVVGGYGAGLLSRPELIIAVILPAVLLFWLLYRPLKGEPLIFIILFVVITFGWVNRLNRPLHRNGSEMALLPDYIHKQLYYWSKIGFGKKRFLQITNNIETTIPRNLNGYYKVVKNKGIMIEPIEISHNPGPKKYNIIFILMESLRAYECGFLGAKPSFTPGLDELAKNASVYTNFYANGTQTVRSELACLCSVYTNPIGVPDYLVNPSIKLISLPEILGEFGYDTLWFSGYTADFHNKRAFLSKHGLKKIFDRDVLPKPTQPLIGWGMNDCEMFGYVWDILKDANEPFFAQITTLSSHCAKETKYPTEDETPVVQGSELYRIYTRGTYYTDYAVSQFIEKVLDSNLAENTIIIITGDHGLWLFPKGITDPLQKLDIMFRVPLCIWGPSDLIKSGRDNTLGSHVDLPPTLMDVLNIRHNNTFLGQSLLNQDIPYEQRYVVTLLGSISHLRVGDIFSLSKFRLDEETNNIGKYAKVEQMGLYKRVSLDFMTVKGDLFRGSYNAELVEDYDKIRVFSQRLDDIVFLTSYGIYFNAYEGAN